MKRFAAAVTAIALLIAGCGGATVVHPSSGVPGTPTISVGPVVTPTPLTGAATVTQPDLASILDTKAYGPVPVNQIIVMLADNENRSDADALAKSLGGAVVGQIDFLNAYQIQTSGTTESDLTAALAKAQATAGVTLAAPNQETRVADDTTAGEIVGVPISPTTTNAAYSGSNADGYNLIGVDKAWQYIRGSGMPLSPVQTGVIDTGLWTGTGEFDQGVKVGYTDPSAKLAAPEQDTVPNGRKLDDIAGGHGSAVATLIGGDSNNGGAAGVASVLGNKLSIEATNLFSADYGNKFTPTAANPDDPTLVQDQNDRSYQFADLVAITKQIQSGSTIINMSFGPADYNKIDMAIPNIYRSFYKKMAQLHPNVLFVAAAGNNGIAMHGACWFPGGFALPNVITVGNVDNNAKIDRSSNRPGINFEVTVYAPGQQAVEGYDPKTGGVENTNGGTSMATPQVTATAALLRSLNKDLTAAQLKQLITSSMVLQNGVPILSVDQAVLKVIELNANLAGEEPPDPATLLGRGGVDSAAIPVADTTDTYTVNATIKALANEEKGVDLDIVVGGGTLTSGDDTAHLDAPGQVSWTVQLNKPGHGLITIHRLDNQAGSRITIAPIDVTGTWKGVFTLTDYTADAAAEAEAEKQGCDLSTLEGLKGKPLPMTITLKVKPESTGTATFTVTSPESSEPSTPQTMPVTYEGNQLTFKISGGEGITESMTGTVSRTMQSSATPSATIQGVITISGSGFSAHAVWTVNPTFPIH